MQIKDACLSQLRQRLLRLCHLPYEAVSPFLGDQPFIKGTLYTLRRKCSKLSCRCARGRLHESPVLTASVAAKTRLWTIAPERVREIRESTQAYQRFRRARKELLQELDHHRVQMLAVIAAIEKIRLRSP